MNIVHLIGNVGTITPPASENAPLKMSIATKSPYKKEGKKVTDWHNITVFSPKMKELYLKKIGVGSQIAVTGSLHTNKFEGDDGTKYFTEIYADTVEFVNLKKPQ